MGHLCLVNWKLSSRIHYTCRSCVCRTKGTPILTTLLSSLPPLAKFYKRTGSETSQMLRNSLGCMHVVTGQYVDDEEDDPKTGTLPLDSSNGNGMVTTARLPTSSEYLPPWDGGLVLTNVLACQLISTACNTVQIFESQPSVPAFGEAVRHDGEGRTAATQRSEWDIRPIV